MYNKKKELLEISKQPLSTGSKPKIKESKKVGCYRNLSTQFFESIIGLPGGFMQKKRQLILQLLPASV
jgi:hypothetical protein